MRRIENPRQTRLFDSFDAILTPKTKRELLGGWPCPKNCGSGTLPASISCSGPWGETARRGVCCGRRWPKTSINCCDSSPSSPPCAAPQLSGDGPDLARAV